MPIYEHFIYIYIYIYVCDCIVNSLRNVAFMYIWLCMYIRVVKELDGLGVVINSILVSIITKRNLFNDYFRESHQPYVVMPDKIMV